MKIVKAIEHFILYISILLISSLFLLVFVQVLSRNFFSHSFLFIEEVSMLLLSWCVFLSAAYTLKKKGHVVVDFIYTKFSQFGQNLISFLTLILILIFLVFIVYYGWNLSMRQMKISMPITGYSRGWLFMSVPFSGVFMIVFIMDELMMYAKSMIRFKWRG